MTEETTTPVISVNPKPGLVRTDWYIEKNMDQESNLSECTYLYKIQRLGGERSINGFYYSRCSDGKLYAARYFTALDIQTPGDLKEITKNEAISIITGVLTEMLLDASSEEFA